jgi:hypothetical protein
MESELSPLFDQAFLRAKASQANEVIERAREMEGEGSKSFEMVVPPEAGVEWLEAKLLPRLVYHLESLGVRPPGYPGVFLSLFVGDELCCVRTRDAMAFAAAQLHLSADQMVARWGTGEVRHAVRLGDDGEVPALPPETDD